MKTSDSSFHLVENWIYLQQIQSEQQLYDLGLVMADKHSMNLQHESSQFIDRAVDEANEDRFDLDITLFWCGFIGPGKVETE